MSEVTKDIFSEPDFFENQHIREGEYRPGLLLGMADYEIIEDNDVQVVIGATIDPEDVYGATAQYMHIKLWTKTIYFNKSSRQVEKVKGHPVVSAEELTPDLQIDGKSVKENDLTFVTICKDIDSSPEFELPECSK